MVFSYPDRSGKSLAVRSQLLAVVRALCHLWKAAAVTFEHWHWAALQGHTLGMRTSWLFSRRRALSQVVERGSLPWNCWRAQTLWLAVSLSFLSQIWMLLEPTHQKWLYQTIDSTCRQPNVMADFQLVLHCTSKWFYFPGSCTAWSELFWSLGLTFLSCCCGVLSISKERNPVLMWGSEIVGLALYFTTENVLY